ncbi:MAG TPA: hypothetical protein VKA28_00090 [Candidatus Bathyarchaeia archaeon]|nr:hypothetical protein [Candidatus Bathyarchaeia archaeon]
MARSTVPVGDRWSSGFVYDMSFEEKSIVQLAYYVTVEESSQLITSHS